ncbi:hypothetical protein D3C71_2103520 [compost metagenome]
MPDAFDTLCSLVADAPLALQRVEKELPPDFPEPVWRAVEAGVRTQCARFEAGLDQAQNSTKTP